MTVYVQTTQRDDVAPDVTVTGTELQIYPSGMGGPVIFMSIEDWHELSEEVWRVWCAAETARSAAA